jgi:hypothetical protein
MRRAAAFLVLLAIGGLPAGCDWAKTVTGRINPDTVGLADRCANVMKAAMPFADIDIGKLSSENTGIRTITARAEGTRNDAPKDVPIARDLAVECQFDSNILTAFRWTKGGPPPPPAVPPSPPPPGAPPSSPPSGAPRK